MGFWDLDGSLFGVGLGPSGKSENDWPQFPSSLTVLVYLITQQEFDNNSNFAERAFFE